MSCERIQRLLSDGPITANRIAQTLGMHSEEVYTCLVRLYDRGEARIEIGYGNKLHKRPDEITWALGWKAKPVKTPVRAYSESETV